MNEIKQLGPISDIVIIINTSSVIRLCSCNYCESSDLKGAFDTMYAPCLSRICNDMQYFR